MLPEELTRNINCKHSNPTQPPTTNTPKTHKSGFGQRQTKHPEAYIVYIYIYIYIYILCVYIYIYTCYIQYTICTCVYTMYIHTVCIYIYDVCVYTYIYIYIYILVSGLNHPEKYESRFGILLLIYGKIKNVWNHQPVYMISTVQPICHS